MHLHYFVGPWLGTSVLQRLPACAHVVTVSEFIHSQALRHGVRVGHATTIRNTIDPSPPLATGTRAAVRAELGVPPDAPLIGMVARLDPWKAQQDVIAAFAKVIGRHPSAYLLFVGDGRVRPALEAQAGRTLGPERILFAGGRLDIPRILAALDIFMHPSRDEAFGLAVAEAAGSGLPGVAYAEGATPELPNWLSTARPGSSPPQGTSKVSPLVWSDCWMTPRSPSG